jgi:2-dehydropantoate 2-reductase
MPRRAGKVRQLARVAMTESMTIAERLGIKFGVTLEQRIDGARTVGAHKPSMLQDIKTKRPAEVDAVVGAVVELGKIVRVPTPVTGTLYRAVKLREKRVRGT